MSASPPPLPAMTGAPSTLDRIPPREIRTGRIHVIVETPAGSPNKYKLDTEYGVFRLSRRLPAGLVFPHDFGFIPGTHAPDGDPLDVMVLASAPTFPGCLITARLIGVLRAQQVENRKTIQNDRLIAVAETPVNATRIRGIQQLQRPRLEDIEHFFEAYNRAQGRPFKITGRAGRQAAEAVLLRAVGNPRPRN